MLLLAAWALLAHAQEHRRDEPAAARCFSCPRSCCPTWPTPPAGSSPRSAAQPWIVFGLMKIEDGVSPSVTAGEVLFTLVGFTLLYGALMVADVYLLDKYAKAGLQRDPSPTRRRSPPSRRGRREETTMDLNTLWFILIGVLFTGLLRPRGLRLRRRHPAALPRQDRRGAAADHQHHRPGLGRQRGVDAHRRRGDLRRLPPLVRHPVQRLLPGAVPDAGRADRARGRVRVPQQGREPGLARPVGLVDLRRQRDPRPALGRGPRQPAQGHPDRRRRRRSPAGSSTCSAPTRSSPGSRRSPSSSPTVRSS